MKIETIAVHAGHAVDPATGAVAAPIYLSTTFERDVEGTYSRGFMYTRNDNPNRQALERGVAMLEGGEAAAAFASGTGAAMSILQPRSPKSYVMPARFSFATIHGRRSCNGRSTSARI